MHPLRLGVLVATQGRVLDQDTAPEVAVSPQETKPAEVKQEVANEVLETQPQLGGSITSQDLPENSPAVPSESVAVKEVPAEVANASNPGVQESQPEGVSFVATHSVEVAPEVTKESQEANASVSKVVSPVEKQLTSNEISKDQEPGKEEVITQNHPEVQGRDNSIQLVYEQPGQNQNQNQIPQISIQDLEKIFKYQGVQVGNGSQSLNQYPGYYNKYQSYPNGALASGVNTSDANATQHIHTHYYPNQKKPGLPLPFLANPFQKQEPVYVNLNQTANSTSNVTYHTHIHEETKPFPFLPNPFTDFPKVVGLSLVLLPNPFYVNKNQNQNLNHSQVAGLPAGYQENGGYPYFGKLRSFSEEPQKQQQQKQQSQQQQPQQQQTQKPNFYLIPNPLASQASGDGQKADASVLFPINLAALPLLVPASELFGGNNPPSASISFQDLIKATNVHVSQPIKLQANNGLTQVQKEQAAVQQLLLNHLKHLNQQQLPFQEQPVAGGKRSQSAQPVVQLQEEEESSVLFAVEIPKPIYRFFKGIFGGFSN
ncbi:RNA polymerase II degradation factor 1 [Drosophila erecta]|uniref:RNA polymerase II degradation factor 1 n=1 Tax=Drosophila erecta TaxID=7220 RepID=UPI000177F9C7|nr:RNA polymerase II degradation factor 1 [Drosophila erecta]